MIIFLGLVTSAIFAQVTFILDDIPSYTPAGDDVYIAGDFNGWNPGDPANVLLKNNDGKWEITLAAQPDQTSIQYKFTRGSWAKVEKGASGEEIPNRTFTYGNGETVHAVVYNWADNGGGNSTAAPNVTVMSTDFYMPQLNRYRRIILYLPPDYETSGLNYPVIYMHDGQNLFDAYTSFAGEWEVDETLNELNAAGHPVPLVVGIDNGGADRIGEYTPWRNKQYGGGDGELYIRFIAETLKPYIDEHYRTLTDRSNTALMGSSLGGLISHYGALSFQDIFSKAGLFSPSYWFSDSIWSFTHETGRQDEMRFYQLCGTNESSGMVAEMQRMNDSLVSVGFSQDDVFNKVVQGGQHNEQLWREGFGEAYLWLFNSYAYAVSEPAEYGRIVISPNPVYNMFSLSGAEGIYFDPVQIFDIHGRNVKTFTQPQNNIFDVSELSYGIYFVRCIKDNIAHGGLILKR